MTGMHSVPAKSGILELNQVRSSDPNRERGNVGSFQQKKVGGITRRIRKSAPTSVALLFSLRDGAVVFCRYAIKERQARQRIFYSNP